MKKKVVILVIAMIVVTSLLSGCSFMGKKSRGTLSILEQWQETQENFENVIKAIGDGSDAQVELRVIETDDKGYIKKYEFVGLKDGKEFLKYDEDGYLKD